MALPAGILTALSQVAMSPKVQQFATGLVKNVYGRVMPSRTEIDAADAVPPHPKVTLEFLAARIADLPNRDELVTAFAVLQADIDRQNQMTRNFLVGGLAIHLAVLAGLGVALLR